MYYVRVVNDYATTSSVRVIVDFADIQHSRLFARNRKISLNHIDQKRSNTSCHCFAKNKVYSTLIIIVRVESFSFRMQNTLFCFEVKLPISLCSLSFCEQNERRENPALDMDKKSVFSLFCMISRFEPETAGC